MKNTNIINYCIGNGSNAPSIVISTKSINGVCVDPFNHNRLASFGDDGIIKIWDIRYVNHNNDAISFYI